ncbi:hypothetical protein ACFLTM_03330 [Candidatus Bipolaricaulota bacterium]
MERKHGIGIALCALLVVGLAFAAAAADLYNGTGRLTMLRVHDVGTGYGSPSNFLDAEVVFRVDTSDKAFGFQLRNDTNSLVHQAMFSLLLQAYINNLTVYFDYWQEAGKTTCEVIRIWLGK